MARWRLDALHCEERISDSLKRRDPGSNLVLEQPMVESQGEWVTINHEGFGSWSFRQSFVSVQFASVLGRVVAWTSRFVNKLTWATMRRGPAKWGHFVWRQHCWRDHVSQELKLFARAQCSVYPTAPKISPNSLNSGWNLFVVKSCGGMQRAIMQSIVLLIVLLCFQVKLDWFTEPVAAVQHILRSVGRFRPIVPVKAPCTVETFEWRTKESLGALPLRNKAMEVHFQVDCRVVLPSCWPMCAKLRRICSNEVLHSATLTGTSSLATLWNRLAVANWSIKSYLLRMWSRSQTLACRNIEKLGTRFPEIELKQGKVLSCECTNWK